MCSNGVEHPLNDRIPILKTRKSVRRKDNQNLPNFASFKIEPIEF